MGFTFTDEADFEEALIKVLVQKGWENKIIKYPTEEDLIHNWANILFENNRHIDKLNECPLTDGEMQQIMEQITLLKTPLKLNSFINGKSVSIKRDNPDDKLHFGKEVSLKIYERNEIAAGQSRYQIVQQPIFKAKTDILNDRRGDLMLLINGMPVIHIELKKSGVPVSQACNQIVKYSHENVFTGIFSLVQIFVAMEPSETKYFANPGPNGKFNENYYFHWADFNNEPINEWDKVAESLLSIPMAHMMIGFYTVADNTDGVLKVMRSYQYYAASRISDAVAKSKWNKESSLGGYVWHTTGSGKTMTSFKSAQLIANSKEADKVVFLMDRIELGTQSLRDYRGFADDSNDVQDTEDTEVLITKLKSDDVANTLIVTSIQKMSRIKEEANKVADIGIIASKKIVFIIDEAHRSTFGDMLITIKNTFPNAMFFGFTGTPIQDENQKKMNTTATVFGDELHRYSIADGIRDGNVLGFDPYMVMTFKEKDIRRAVALDKAKAKDEEEAISNPDKSEVYYYYMDSSKVPMAGFYDENGEYTHGIEDYIKNVQYKTEEHKNTVVEDIVENWNMLSHNGKFHAIFATANIPEAIEYYKKLRIAFPKLKITTLFDPSIDNNGEKALDKEDGLVEILTDYNNMFGQKFSLKTYSAFKKDVAARLAHKKPYNVNDNDSSKQLDLLIVVNQMLTGFDSKWINTLYLDKVLEYENIIQAFSRTNRLFGPDKPHGTIRYYRYPHTMKANIEKAVSLYSGDKVQGLFVNNLEYNIKKMNEIFDEINLLFEHAGINDFSALPESNAERAKFAKLFNEYNRYLEAALIQGFEWDKSEYPLKKDNNSVNKKDDMLSFEENVIVCECANYQTYITLIQRYKELDSKKENKNLSVPYDVKGYLTEYDTGLIDKNYMNTKFNKYLWILGQDNVDENELKETLDDLHKSFASLTQEEQKFASIFLHDIQCGAIKLQVGKSFMDYVVEYQNAAKNDQIYKIATIFGLDEALLRDIMTSAPKENINEYGKFDALKATVDKNKAKVFFDKLENSSIPLPLVNVKVDKYLRDFIEKGGFDVNSFDLSSDEEKALPKEYPTSVTGRIRSIKQPNGGYLNPDLLEVISFEDNNSLSDKESISPSIIGLVVDYMTRMLLGEDKLKAFDISLEGAKIASNNGLLGSIDNASKLINDINGLDEVSIISACELVTYDVWYRNLNYAIGSKLSSNIGSPDKSTVNNIRIMIQRSLDFWNSQGPIVKSGFTFEGGYSKVVISGDGDFLTKDTLWDLKVTKDIPSKNHTLQILMYFIMGKKSGKEIFKSTDKIGIYNPRHNKAYVIELSKIEDSIIKQVEKEVLCY